MTTAAVKAWSMDAGPTGPITPTAVPPHKLVGATAPQPKMQDEIALVKAKGWDADTLLDKIVDARASNNPLQVAYYSRLLHLVTAGDAIGAVREAFQQIAVAMRDAAVGLPFEVALSERASHTFDEPLMVLNEHEEIRWTIERRPIRPQVKQGTANPAPVGKGVNPANVGANAPEDNTPAQYKLLAVPYTEIRAKVKAGEMTREDGEVEVCDAEEVRLKRELTEDEIARVVASFDEADATDIEPKE